MKVIFDVLISRDGNVANRELPGIYKCARFRKETEIPLQPFRDLFIVEHVNGRKVELTVDHLVYDTKEGIRVMIKELIFEPAKNDEMLDLCEQFRKDGAWTEL